MAPVNPLTGAKVRVMPGAVAPGLAEVLVLHGVMEKSGLVVETTSMGVSPTLGTSKEPLDPA